MRTVRSLSGAVLVLFGALTFAEGQDADTLGTWVGADSQEGGRAVLIAPESGFVNAVAVKDENGLIAATDWQTGTPFLKRFVLAPGTYELVFPEQKESVTVSIEPGKQAYVEALADAGVTVSESPTGLMLGTYNELADKGYANFTEPQYLSGDFNRLFFEVAAPKPPLSDDEGPSSPQ